MSYLAFKEKKKVLVVSPKLLRRFFDVAAEMTKLQEELEDELLWRDVRIVKLLKKARQEHLKGKVKPLAELLR